MNTNSHKEIISAIFIIVLTSILILANFAFGFIFYLFIAMMALSAIISFLYPRSGVCAVIFLTFIFERFFTLQSIVWGRSEYKIYPLDIIFVAIIAGIIWQLISKQISLKIKRIDWYLIAFILISGVYFLFSAFILKTDFSLSFSTFKNYAFYSLFYFVIITLFQDKNDIKNLLKFAFAGAIGIIFFILYGILGGQGLWSEYTPLSTEGVRTLAFTHGFYLSLVLIGFLSYLSYQSKKSYQSYALIAIWTVGIVGSMMRHLWFSLIAALAILYLLIPKIQKENYRKIIYIFSVILIIIFSVIFYFNYLFPNSDFSGKIGSASGVITHRFNSVFSASTDESFSWRDSAWKEALKEYASSPIFGIGFGKSISLETGKFHDFVEMRDVHNSPLIILVQMGAITFLIFAIFVFKNIKSLYKKAVKDWIDCALIALIVFYLIIFLFQPYLETNLLGIFFWIILGLIRICHSCESRNLHKR